MKIYSIFAVVMMAFSSSLFSMDKPLPCEQVSTPKGERVRLNIFKLAHDAIEGRDADNECDLENLDPQLLEASPVSFSKGLRSIYERRFEEALIKKGITPEMIKDRFDDALALIREENEQISSCPLESPLKKECSAVAKKMGVSTPEFKKARLDNPAECRGDLVLIDPEYLHDEAPTPGRRACIVAHELRHRANGEYRKQVATSMACDVAGVNLSPSYLRKRSRCNEFFADLEMAALDSSLADSSRILTRQNRQVFGDGTPSTHPSFKQRELESKLSCDLHEAHKQERRAKPIKRNLMKEFEEQEKQSASSKHALKDEFESAWGN